MTAVARSLAVHVVGPVVEAGGFAALLSCIAATAVGTLVAALLLPRPSVRPNVPPGSPRAAD